MDDNAIVALYWARSEDAIEETNKKYGTYCWQVSYNILRNGHDADECVNDTWLRAWNALPPQRPSRLQAFLAKITRNLSLDRWEQSHTQKRGGGQTAILLSELSDCIPSSSSIDQTLSDQALSETICRWLRDQPQKSRVAFIRRYWYADSVHQVAKRIGLTESGTKSLLHRLRRNLKDYLEQEGIVL
ncbi:MAG: sigma-70 family RNA polymerase sigma factor [Oscillospiraceae bacterium]|nr:sigma-70 family RNA polymerase sigma factor [Oscillospiraceae bacterium]